MRPKEYAAELAGLYETLKATSVGSLGNTEVANLISSMALCARNTLRSAERVPLTSGTGKNYFSFRQAEQSRPVNVNLYADKGVEFDNLLGEFRKGFQGTTTDLITKAVYSIAYSVFAAHDITSVGRAASSTFFERIIGHVVARTIGVPPRNRVLLPESPVNEPAYLPTDYLFDAGQAKRKIHLPIKTPTRERAVQAWVHQLVLDRIFGAGKYRGVLVAASETKRDTKTGEVIEICVPRQLQMFQARVAEMTRIYYLDPPKKYLKLSDGDPKIDVRPFGEAVADLPQLLGAR